MFTGAFSTRSLLDGAFVSRVVCASPALFCGVRQLPLNQKAEAEYIIAIMDCKMTTDVRVVSAEVYFLPVTTRVPLKFGAETLTGITAARVRVTVKDSEGRTAVGWGETPLNVQWFWPSSAAYEPRHQALRDLCGRVAEGWVTESSVGHPMELCHDFTSNVLPALSREFNAERDCEDVPYLAALGVVSCVDIATHDAYGNLHKIDVYDTYSDQYMNRDLAHFLTEVDVPDMSFAGKFPADFLQASVPSVMPAWHLVGGLDALDESELTGNEPDDGYPVHLRQWMETDGLNCLKIKLRGNDSDWDYQRLVGVGKIAVEFKAEWLTADFNCTVTDPEYVNSILDKLKQEHPNYWDMISYVEQPFPHDLEANRIDVHSVSERKPLFLDESAHDWKFVRLGRQLGWSGVALKTCKTQTGALLSLCWAKAHGMPLMVQDLTNPMLAQIPHMRLAAHAGTIMGVETNSMQFYPEASLPEATVHPGIYRRRNGQVDLSTLNGSGFGYRVDEIERELPAAEFQYG